METNLQTALWNICDVLHGIRMMHDGITRVAETKFIRMEFERRERQKALGAMRRAAKKKIFAQVEKEKKERVPKASKTPSSSGQIVQEYTTSGGDPVPAPKQRLEQIRRSMTIGISRGFFVGPSFEELYAEKKPVNGN